MCIYSGIPVDVIKLAEYDCYQETGRKFNIDESLMC